MARRRIVDEPTSRLAIWARRTGFFALAVVLLAIIIVRSGMLEIMPVLVTFGAALVVAVVAILVALAAFVSIWRSGAAGLGHAVGALFIGLALIAYPAYLVIKGYKLPPIADITTDPIDPPRFEAVARLRTRDANPIVYAGLYAAEQQRAAYPDIEPLMLAVAPDAAYDAAMTVITKRKWRIVDARSPQGGRRDGHIEAVARTPVMGFRDDVVVRIRAATGGTRIDVRSASRYGRYDFGANASRIRSLFDDIDDLASVEKPERKEPRPPAQGAACQGRSVGQAIDAGDRRRALGRDEAARHQVLEMGEHRQPGGAGEARIEPDIDRPHQGRDVGRALAEPVQDRRLAAMPVVDVLAHETRRVAYGAAVAGQIEPLVAPRELVERRHVVAHRAVRRRHDRWSTTPSRDRPRTAFVPAPSANAMWLAVWPGVAIASMRQPSPSTTSPSASTRSGRNSMSPRGVEALGLADMQRPRRAVRTLRQRDGAGRRLDGSRGGRMVAMGVGDEDVRHGLAAHRIEQRRDMGFVVRAGIDDRHLAAADDVAHRPLEGERARVVAQQAAHARRDLLDPAGRQVEALVESDVVAHEEWPEGVDRSSVS